MDRPPRCPDEPLLSPFLIWRVFLVSLLFVAGIFLLYDWHYQHDSAIENARTIAVNTLVMFQVAYLINTRSLLGTALSWRGLFGNGWLLLAVAVVVALQLLFTYAPPLQMLFASTALTAVDWLGIVALSLLVFLIVETEKTLIRHFAKRSQGSPTASLRTLLA